MPPPPQTHTHVHVTVDLAKHYRQPHRRGRQRHVIAWCTHAGCLGIPVSYPSSQLSGRHSSGALNHATLLVGPIFGNTGRGRRAVVNGSLYMNSCGIYADFMKDPAGDSIKAESLWAEWFGERASGAVGPINQRRLFLERRYYWLGLLSGQWSPLSCGELCPTLCRNPVVCARRAVARSSRLGWAADSAALCDQLRRPRCSD